MWSKNLQKQTQLLNFCANCQICRDSCPTYTLTYNEAFSPAGRIRIIKSLMENPSYLKSPVNSSLFSCTTCEACQGECSIDFPLVNMIEETRAIFASNPKFSHPIQDKFEINFLSYGNPYGESPQNRSNWIKELKSLPHIEENITDQGEIGYFVGCTASFRDPLLALHGFLLLQQATSAPIVLFKEEEMCCGSPYLRTGSGCHTHGAIKKNRSKLDIRKHIVKNIELIKSRGIKKLICSCAGCYKTMKIDWVKIYGEIPFEVIHITEFLEKHQNLTGVKKIDLPRLIYHDPCHLSRFCGITEAPRVLLKSILEADIEEFPLHHEKAICCGSGGGVKAAYPEIALTLAKQKLDYMESAGITHLVTSCVFCKQNFQNAVNQYQKDIVIQNIEDLLMLAYSKKPK